jgi:hypothetical protein
VNASPTLTSIAVTASEGRARSHARSNARRSIRSRCLPEGSDARDIPAGLILPGYLFFVDRCRRLLIRSRISDASLEAIGMKTPHGVRTHVVAL